MILNIVRAHSNNQVKYLDHLGLWKVERKTENMYGIATAEKGDTIKKLAVEIGLEENEWKSWLGTPPNSKLPEGLNSTTVLPQDCKFLIPNTIIAMWAGFDLLNSGIGPGAVRYYGDLSWLRIRGFNVKNHFLTEELQKTKGKQLFKVFLNSVSNLSKVKALHGIYFWGHGNKSAISAHFDLDDDKTSVQTRYADVHSLLEYRLGFLLLNACLSGFSSGEKGFDPAEKGGMDLVSSNGKSGANRDIVWPLINHKHPSDIMKPGDQHTIKN